MIKHINKRGFYTVEAAIVLPLVILAMISIGYYMRVYSIWENCMHAALDESSYTAALYCDGITKYTGKSRIRNRIISENPRLCGLEISHYFIGYTDLTSDNITSFNLIVDSSLALPLDFGNKFQYKGRIKYRGFTGLREGPGGMGSEALETTELRDPVYIFPQYGEKYHEKNCTYVNAQVKAFVLSSRLKRMYSPCGLCHSEKIKSGSIVFCFSSEDSAYHYGSCRSIKRRPVVCNKNEAIEKGYGACSKCGH